MKISRRKKIAKRIKSRTSFMGTPGDRKFQRRNGHPKFSNNKRNFYFGWNQ